MTIIENVSLHPARRRSASRVLYFYFIISFIVVFLGSTGYIYYYYKKSQNNPLVVEKSIEAEAKNIAQKVGILILLPQNETPTLATVTDITKLSMQPFFKNAANGNKVLIYPASKLAVIYDISRNLIVNVGPVNTTAKISPSESVTKTAFSG